MTNTVNVPHSPLVYSEWVQLGASPGPMSDSGLGLVCHKQGCAKKSPLGSYATTTAQATDKGDMDKGNLCSLWCHHSHGMYTTPAHTINVDNTHFTCKMLSAL